MQKCMNTASHHAFDWTLVARFLAVLDAGSLSGAARALNTHQGTLSRQIADLEEQLGGPLFERTGRGLSPTALAQSIAVAARHMESGALALGNSVSRSRSKTRGSVRIAASRAVAALLMPSVLARMAQAMPDVSVDLVASDEVANLLRRDADIAIRMVRPAQSSLIARKLTEMPIVAAAHRDYLARMGTPKAVDDLAAHRLIGFDQRRDILDHFGARGLPITRDSFALRTDDQIAYARLIQEGAGIGFVSLYNLRFLPGVVRVLPQLKVPSLTCWLVVHREIRSDPLIRSVYDFLGSAMLAAIRG